MKIAVFCSLWLLVLLLILELVFSEAYLHEIRTAEDLLDSSNAEVERYSMHGRKKNMRRNSDQKLSESTLFEAEGDGLTSSTRKLSNFRKKKLRRRKGARRSTTLPLQVSRYGPWLPPSLHYVASQMRRQLAVLDLKAKTCGLHRDRRGVAWNVNVNYDGLTRWKDPAIRGSLFDHTVSFRYRRGRRGAKRSRHTSAEQCAILQRGIDYEFLRSRALVAGRPFDGPKLVRPVVPDEGLSMIAVVFPQYHAFPQNDQFWGTNFTEWSNLQLAFYNPSNFQAVKHPIGSHGAYYNFLDVDQRQLAGKLARHYGIQGFAYHHYWYNCDTKFMETPLLRMLEDGEPDLNFTLIWANHKWTRHWDGHNGETLQDQTYGDELCWRLHFKWLLQFFLHPKYIKVDGKPMFLFYVISEIPEATFRDMLTLWRKLAIDAGLPGLHIVECLNRDDAEASPYVDALMEYQPNFRRAYIKNDTAMEATKRLHDTYYRGEYVGWDNFPRHNSEPGYENGGLDDDPIHVEARLRRRMEIARRDPNKGGKPNYFFLTAWNEWGEGNNLEPDNIYGYGSINAAASAYAGSKYDAENKVMNEQELLNELQLKMKVCNLRLDLFLYNQLQYFDFRQFRGWSEMIGPEKIIGSDSIPGRKRRREKIIRHWQTIGFFNGREFRLKPDVKKGENWVRPDVELCSELVNAVLDKTSCRFLLEREKQFESWFL